MNGIGVACDRSGGRSHCRCLNAFTRDMISGRGFIGIAAQSLGMGRPVLTPIWALIFGAACAVGCGAGLRKAPAAGCHAALCHHQIVGLMLAGMRKKHAKYTPLRFHGCGPSLLKPKRTPQALPAGFRSVVILRTCVAQGQIADGGSGCGREVRPTGHHAPGVDGPGEDAL